MKKSEFGVKGETAKTDKNAANNPRNQTLSQPKPPKKINWNSLMLIVLLAAWLFASVFFAIKIVKSISTEKETTAPETVEQAGNMQSPEQTGGIQSPAPSNTAQSPEPSELAQSPEPTASAQSPSPSSAAQSPKPTGGTQSPAPTSAVQSPKPTATPTPSSGNNQTSNSGTSTSTANADLIKAIREKYNYAQSNLANCEVKEYGTASKAFYLNGGLILLRENAKDSADGKYNQHWYYDNGAVYFIFMTETSTGGEYRLYFNNGKLIRWIDPNGKIYDSSYRWDEMQSFYDHAKAQCDSMSAG